MGQPWDSQKGKGKLVKGGHLLLCGRLSLGEPRSPTMEAQLEPWWDGSEAVMRASGLVTYLSDPCELGH